MSGNEGGTPTARPGESRQVDSPAPVATRDADDRTGPLAPSENERAASARARGLSAPYIAGGRDPQPDEALREERFYGRLLVLMVAIIVLAGFVLGIVAGLMGFVGGG
jgi:hypothetical protein